MTQLLDLVPLWLHKERKERKHKAPVCGIIKNLPHKLGHKTQIQWKMVVLLAVFYYTYQPRSDINTGPKLWLHHVSTVAQTWISSCFAALYW